MRTLLLILCILLSRPAEARCGLSGTVADRLRDCRAESAEWPGYQVISVTTDGAYLYHAGEDLIVSPPLKRSEKKCLRPYKRIGALSRVMRLLPKHGETPPDSARCVLREASRYVLLPGERFL